MRQLVGELEQLRRRTGAMLLVQRSAVVAAWAIGTILALVLLDYALRLPGEFRLIFLIAGGGALLAGLWKYLGGALAHRPSLTQLALRVERSLPSLSGRLASCIEFALSGEHERNPFAARSVRETQRRLAGESIGALIRRGKTLRHVGVMLVIVALAVTLAAGYPAAARTGLARLLLPYGSARWPARTAVASLMHEVAGRGGVYPRGRALPLRARNLTVGAEAERVDAHYRLIREGGSGGDSGGGSGAWHQIVLTHQGGGVHERLVDTDAEAIDLFFTTEDARTERRRIALVPPPAVARATVTIAPPAYASDRLAPLQAGLGPGIDERAVTESPSLVGSEVSLLLKLNKPLPVPSSPAERESWMRQTFGWNGEHLPRFAEDPDDAGRWRLSWTLQATCTLSLNLRDAHGLTNDEPIRYRILAVADLPPTVIVTEPERDETVLPTAVVGVAGEGRDDVALSRVGLRTHIQRGEAEAAEELPFAPQREADGTMASIEAELDLAGFDLTEGDTVIITAVGEDAFQLQGRRREPVISTVRRLRIISEADLAAQLRRELAAVRQNAVRVEAIQAELQDDVMESGVQPGLRGAQARLGDRLRGQREAIERLQDRSTRNRMQDEQLAGLLQQSGDLLDYAGRAGNRAMEAIESRLGAPDDLAAGSAAEDNRLIIEAQQEVREELADLIKLLDRDEDTWLVERELETLIEQQVALERQTADLAPKTIGRNREDLAESQLRDLDRIAQRQREMRDRARRLIEELRRRAEALGEIDPQSAAGMRTAAETGERGEIDRDMERAAEQVEQNRLQTAGSAQQAARHTLGRMMENLRQARRARAEQLLRQLADLIKSIERLIVVQENELIALARGEKAGDFTGRDHAMIRLARNTRSVALEARSASAEAQPIARALDRAADAQEAAITALRALPIDAGAARDAEERSLVLLREAGQLAEGLRQKTQDEQMRKRREALIEAYRLAAEKQIAVRQDTLPLAGGEQLTRRELVEARRLGNAQNEIRIALRELEENTREILESDIFSYAHQLMDQWCGEVSDALWEGDVDLFLTERQEMIAESIVRQIEALKPEPADEFAREPRQGRGGGSAGAQPLIPPVAELKRLRSLQEQVYNQTKAMDSLAEPDDPRRRQRLLETGRMQRKLIEIGRKMLQGLPQPPADAESQQELREE